MNMHVPHEREMGRGRGRRGGRRRRRRASFV